MKLHILYLLLAGLALTWASCGGGGGEDDPIVPDPPIVKPKPNDPKPSEPEPNKPEEPAYPTYDAPRWNVSNGKKYECTMTAILTLPDSMVNIQQANDELAIFVNDECRGVAERVEVSSGKYVWMVMIMGNTSESKTQKLQIRYWSSTNKHMYNSDTTTMFEADTRLGEIDTPYKLGLKIKDK